MSVRRALIGCIVTCFLSFLEVAFAAAAEVARSGKPAEAGSILPTQLETSPKEGRSGVSGT
eukprot:10590815-Alexandrium_andersonii.AAC.1